LTPDVELILADFRSWLQEAKAIPPVAPADTLEVATIVQQFTALRQEVNLQTKASRAQLEQNAQTIAALQQALEELQRQPTPSDEGDSDNALRPLLKTLIDAHDALALAEREVRRMMENLPSPAPPPQPSPPPEIKITLPYWTRWFGLDASIEKQLASLKAQGQPAPSIDDGAARLRQILDALLVGYRMSMQRIERAFEQQSLEPIPCVGEPFDPELMEVAEVVREEGRASTEVIQEVRRGYLWHGRLFRYAQVRVAKP
jgi:molecular chaperone GrpE